MIIHYKSDAVRFRFSAHELDLALVISSIPFLPSSLYNNIINFNIDSEQWRWRHSVKRLVPRDLLQPVGWGFFRDKTAQVGLQSPLPPAYNHSFIHSFVLSDSSLALSNVCHSFMAVGTTFVVITSLYTWNKSFAASSLSAEQKHYRRTDGRTNGWYVT